MPKLWEVVTLRALDKEKRKWLSFEDGQKEEEAISRVSGTWNPTCISCPWRWEYPSLSQGQFLEATEPWAQSLLVLPKNQVSPDLKDQEKTKSRLALSFLYYMFQTGFSTHYPPVSNTELAFQPIWSVHVFPEYIAFCCLLVDASYFDSEHILSLGYAPHLSSKLPNLTHLPRTNLSSSPSGSLPGIFQVSVIISFSDWLIQALAPHFKIKL